MRAARAIVGLVAFVGVWASVGPAVALEPGVFVDPNTPAGKEYSFPLDVQRAAAVGHDAPPGVAQPPLGVGIGPAPVGVSAAGSAASGRPEGSNRGPGASGSATHSSRRSGAPAPGAAASSGHSARSSPNAAALQGLSRPRSTGLQLGLISALVVLGGLLAGAVAAVAARRRR